MSTAVAQGSLDGRRILVIGAGPTGLGAATRLAELGASDVTLLERAAHPGGLASSFRDEAGFTWDVGGHVQFSHYAEFDRAMDRALGDEWLIHDRESWIWMRERFVPYPLQNNVHLLPDADKRACLVGLLRRQPGDTPPSNFSEWVRARFGDGIADAFMLPYNQKVWAYPAAELGYDWVGERVADVDLERLVVNLLDGRADTDWGPNNRFRFPARGGTGAIWRRIAEALPAGWVRYGAEVSGIELDRRRIHLANGTSERYDVLISTMPLDRLARLSGAPLAQAADSLKYSTVHVFGVGLAGAPPASLAKKCWVYYPEANCPYYRLTVFSNYSPFNVPDASRQWSVMVEVSESPAKPVDRARLPDEVIDGLLTTRVIGSRADILSVWQYTAPHGYPTPFLGRDILVDPMLDALARQGVYSRGRFGAWKYEVSNQDHSYMQGVEVVEHLAFGHEERTLRFPNLVNAGKR